MVLVMLSEFVVDWVKHAFITKFNEIPSEVTASLSSVAVLLLAILLWLLLTLHYIKTVIVNSL